MIRATMSQDLRTADSSPPGGGSRALLAGLIDYAGLFPPAELPMAEAFARFLAHRRSDAGWVLARFICPATRFGELEPLLAGTEPLPAPLRIAALGRSGPTLEEFKAGVDADAAAIEAFGARQRERAVVDACELRLPAAGGVALAVEHAWRRLGGGASGPVLSFEVSLLGEWRPRLPAAAAALRDTARASGRRRRLGLKIRCGGPDAAAIPEPLAVAAAIATCRAVGVPLKATQGLHQPFRHRDPQLGVEVHGFLNLLTASVLALVHDLPVTELNAIVAETDPGAFRLGGDEIGWRDHRADAAGIAAARERLLTGFGSCRFAEPRDELRALALID